MTIEKNFLEKFAKATEFAAYGASPFIGKGDKKMIAYKVNIHEGSGQFSYISMHFSNYLIFGAFIFLSIFLKLVPAHIVFFALLSHICIELC